MTLRKRCGLLLCTLVLLISSGCSVFMAARQPDLKNVDLFRVGTPRSMLLGEFGSPASNLKDGKKYEIFTFRQGYSTGAKAGRAFFHGAADVMTLGLWEIVGTPTESVFNGTEMAFEVSYDENNRVDHVVALKGAVESGKNASAETDQSQPNPESKPAVPMNDSVAQKMRELQALRKDGVITEDEFLKKREQLLEKL